MMIRIVSHESLSFIFTINSFMSQRNIVVAISGVLFRTIIDVMHRLVINIFDTAFGFFNWPGKKLRIKIFILPDPEAGQTPSVDNLTDQINYAVRSFGKNFNVDTPHFWIVTGLCVYVVVNFFVFLFYLPLLDVDFRLSVNMWNVHNIAFIIFCVFIAKGFYGTTRYRYTV